MASTTSTTTAQIDDNDKAMQAQVQAYKDLANQYRAKANEPIEIDKSGQYDWMAEVDKARKEYDIENKADRERREAQERKARRIAAISDGLRAIVNFVGTTQGAPNTFTKADLTEGVDKAIAERKADREKKQALYENARKYYLSNHAKQEEDYREKYNTAYKQRQAYSKQADDIDKHAATLQMNIAKLNEQNRHNKEMEKTAERNANSNEKRVDKYGNGHSGGNGGTASAQKAAEVKAAYDFWNRLTPAQRNQFRMDNNRIKDGVAAKDDKAFIVHCYNLNRAYRASKGNGGNGNGKVATVQQI